MAVLTTHLPREASVSHMARTLAWMGFYTTKDSPECPHRTLTVILPLLTPEKKVKASVKLNSIKRVWSAQIKERVLRIFPSTRCAWLHENSVNADLEAHQQRHSEVRYQMQRQRGQHNDGVPQLQRLPNQADNSVTIKPRAHCSIPRPHTCSMGKMSANSVSSHGTMNSAGCTFRSANRRASSGSQNYTAHPGVSIGHQSKNRWRNFSIARKTLRSIWWLTCSKPIVAPSRYSRFLAFASLGETNSSVEMAGYPTYESMYKGPSPRAGHKYRYRRTNLTGRYL